MAAPYGPVRFRSNWPSYSQASPTRGKAKQNRFPTHRERIFAARQTARPKTLRFPEQVRDFCFRSDDDLAQLAAVRAGVGIGVCQVPLASMRADLVRVLPQVAVPLETWVVMHEDQRRAQRVRLVFEALVAGLSSYVKSSEPTPKRKRVAS